jgi:hypothetical protein
MGDQMQYIKPFLVLLNVMPSKLYNVCDNLEIDADLIPMDPKIVGVLRREVLYAKKV